MKTSLAKLLLIATLIVAACQATPTPFHCQDGIGCVTVPPGEPLKLAILQTLSGGSSPAGTEQLRTVQLVLSQHENKFLGHPIQLQVEDERCSAEGGANAALKVIADPQSVAIFGTNCSGAGIAAGKIMSDAGLVMISSANTSPLLTSVNGEKGSGWVPGYFRTAWNDIEMGKAAADFAREGLKVSKAAVINAGDAYSKGLTDVFTQAFEQDGGKVVSEVTIDEDEANQRPALVAVALSDAEMVFFPLSHPEAGSSLVKQSKEVQGLSKLIFIGGEGMLSEVFLKETGEKGMGVYVLGPGAPSSPANDDLRKTYKAAYGENPPSFYYSFAHDAVELLLQALKNVTVQAPDGTLYIGRQALRDTLYATKDFDGLTGKLHCDPYGDCGVATLNIVRIDNPAMSIDELRANIIYTYTSAP
jgi:branched-chain amino acid transport system substrate-binding protein